MSNNDLTVEALLAMSGEDLAALPMHGDSCSGCVGCEGCLSCSGCLGCVDCLGCLDCVGCLRCTGCLRCVNCTDCIGLANTTGASLLAWGVPVTTEQFATLRAKLHEEVSR